MASSSGGSYTSSQETTNFARLCRIVVDVLRDILWQVLINEIPAADLPHRVRTNQNKLGNLVVKIKTWLCGISPSSPEIPTAEKFDVTSLYTMIRNLCSQVPTPSTQWGQPPPQGGTTLGDDIERVRDLRNTLYGHATRAEIDTGDFNNLCTDIKSFVSRFDAYFSSNCTGMKCDFISEIDNILTCSMDKSLQDSYIKKMKDVTVLLDDLHDTIIQHDSDVKEEFLHLNKKVESFLNVMNELKEKAAGIAEIKEILQKQDDVVEKGDNQIQMMPSFEGMSTVRTFTTDEINGAWQSIEQYLLKDLAPKNIVPCLEKLNIFSAEEWKAIHLLRREKIAERILKRIKEKLPDAFNGLLRVLYANKQEVIIENLIKVIEQPSPPEINEPLSPESSYTLTFHVRKGGNTVSEVELKIATLLKAAVMLFAFELLSKVVEILLGSVTIHLRPLSKHAKDTLEFFCKHNGMKNFVLDILKKKDIFSCLPEGNICIQVKVCCYDGDATSEDGNLTDLTKMTEEILSNTLESFEVLNEPQVIRQNLLFQFGYIVEEIEPLQFQDTFVGKGIWDKKFFDQLKRIQGRRARAVKFLNEVGNKDNTVLMALVDALKNSGNEDLACRLCFVEKQLQENKDRVDDSFLEVLTVLPETCTEGELWSCYLEISKRKNVDGDVRAMEVLGSDERKYPTSEDFAQIEPLLVSTEKTSTKDRAYCNHKHRGYALIFMDRKGAQKDEINMNELFSHLRFNVVCRRVHAEDIIKTLREVLADEEFHTDSDCIVCVISAYGSEILSSDGKTFITIEEIFNMVNDCKALEGKPKLFFIQTHEHVWSNRRRKEDAGQNSVTSKTDEGPKHIAEVVVDIRPPIGSLKDTLILYGVPTGYIACRRSDGVVLDCSATLKTLKDVLINIPEDKSLLTALTGVVGKVASDYEFNPKMTDYEVANLTKKDKGKKACQNIFPVLQHSLRCDFYFTQKYD